MTKILLTGRTGQVGWELARSLAPLGHVVATGREQLDLANPDSIRAAIRETRPDIIVNAAGYTTVDKAEAEPEIAMQVNGIAPGILADEAKRAGALLVHYSTDYVYDGQLDRPYAEDDLANPVNTYGKTKLAGDFAVQAIGGAYLILRTSWVYSARGPNFVLMMLRLARENSELRVEDQCGSPSWARRLAEGTAELLRRPDRVRGHSGVYHFAAAGHTTRYEFAREIIETTKELTGVQKGWASLIPIPTGEYRKAPAPRPAHIITSKEKIAAVLGLVLADWRDELRAFLAELAAHPEWRSRLAAGA
jgi:dTDP-4-dehydrorhamnose reductase